MPPHGYERTAALEVPRLGRARLTGADPGAGPVIVMLLASLDGAVGGAQRQADLLARALTRRGQRVVVVSQSPRLRAGVRTTRDAGGERIALPGLGRFSRWALLLAFLAWAAANRRRFHVIHAHSPAAGLTAGLVGRLLGKPVVVKVPGMQAVAALASRRPTRRLRRWILNRTADVVIAVSTEMMEALAGVVGGRARRVLVPNGVDLAAPAARGRAAPRAGWGAAAGAVVLYVGRLEEVKGVRRLLVVWGAMPSRGATLLVVGDGPLRPELERAAAALGPGGAVKFLGFRRDVAPFYALADVFVLPSASEGISNALLEAMAAGLPAVASDVGGNRDLVEDSVSGFLVNWADASLVAARVTSLLDDPDLRRRVGEAARRRAGRFSIALVADRYCALYRALVAPGAAGPQAGA